MPDPNIHLGDCKCRRCQDAAQRRAIRHHERVVQRYIEDQAYAAEGYRLLAARLRLTSAAPRGEGDDNAPE